MRIYQSSETYLVPAVHRMAGLIAFTLREEFFHLIKTQVDSLSRRLEYNAAAVVELHSRLLESAIAGGKYQ